MMPSAHINNKRPMLNATYPTPHNPTASPALNPALVVPGRSEEERIEELAAHLRLRFDVAPAEIRIVRAPLRICPLGAHIDHQLGVVTGLTVDQSLLFAFAPTDDGTIHVDSLNFPGRVTFTLDDVPPYAKREWGNYLRGAVLALRGRYALTRGIVGVIASDMPVGGLSSSAAVIIAYLLALEAVNDLEVTPRTNIELVTATEHGYIGLNNGILDQASELFSRTNTLTRIDCQSTVIESVPSPLAVTDYAWLVVYSGVTEALVGTDYNRRVAECREAAQLLLDAAGAPPPVDPRLRLVAPEIYAAHGRRLPPPLDRRAAHFFGEMTRVEQGLAAWRAGNLSEFGAQINASGLSSIDKYECGSPPLVTLVEILRGAPGVYGTRFSGAGFRGNCIALVDPAAVDGIAAAVHTGYPRRHPEVADRYSVHLCRPDGAATLVPI